MALDYVTIMAAGSYNGLLAGAAVPFGQRGGVVTRTGAGLYQIDLDKGFNIAEGVIMASVKGGTPATIRTNTTSNTRKTIATETVGGAAGPVDVDFDWIALRFAP